MLSREEETTARCYGGPQATTFDQSSHTTTTPRPLHNFFFSCGVVVMHLQRDACSTFQTCILNSHYHPRCRIEMKSCMVGGLQMVVLSCEFHQNRLSGFGAVGVKICPSPLTWPLAYTTACTTVQAVIRHERAIILVFWCQRSQRNSNGVTPTGEAPKRDGGIG